MNESKEKTVHNFPKSSMRMKEILPLLRMAGYSNRDEAGTNIVICPECEDWTHVKFNANSGFNWFSPKREMGRKTAGGYLWEYER